MASMKLYNALADKLRRHLALATECGDHGVYEGLAIACRVVAQVFEEDDPRFDRKRFLSACGLPTKE